MSSCSEYYKMKRSKMLIVLFFGPLLVAQSTHARKAQNNSAANSVSASGYVTAGVEAGCLMLQDSQTKTLYNLLFAGKKKPALGEVIQFTGKRHEGPTTCMQGEAVDVQKWAPFKTLPDQRK